MALLQSRPMLAAAEAARRRRPFRHCAAGDKPCSKSICSIDRSSGCAPGGPSANVAYLRAGLAAIPGQPPLPHQAYSHSARNEQQQTQQRQPSGAAAGSTSMNRHQCRCA